jgi:hypothetical protein
MHCVEMLGRVLVLGRVAAPHVSTRQTESQMNPGITRLNAFFANMLVGVLKFNLVEMGALIFHGSSK